MGWHEMLRDEREEGKAETAREFLLDLLSELGTLSDDVKVPEYVSITTDTTSYVTISKHM